MYKKANKEGKNNKVKAVAIIKPPIIAIAIGPKKSFLDNGIIAKTDDKAVKIIGRKRLIDDSIIAS